MTSEQIGPVMGSNSGRLGRLLWRLKESFKDLLDLRPHEFRTHAQLLAGDEFKVHRYFETNEIRLCAACNKEDTVRIKEYEVAEYASSIDCGVILERVNYCRNCGTACTPDQQVRVNYLRS